VAAAVDCEGVLISVTNRVDAAFLEHCPKLRVVSNIGVGYDHIDIAACTARSVLVTNTPGVVDGATADLTWALILAACRRVAEADAYVRAGAWGKQPNSLFGQEVGGATLGIIGLGRIGQAVARRASGFDMRLLYHQTQRAAPEVEAACKATFVTREELLHRADIVTLHVPYGPQTHHLIGAGDLNRMKRTAVLVNTSRGGVVDDAALVAALQAGTIAAAGLDVYENEPHLHPGFAALTNVVLAPHIGSATMATRAKMMRLAVANLLTALMGAAVPHAVNTMVR
jgi:lactate dehydrogenase-like 2-hydroxyacid dehydrogenase